MYKNKIPLVALAASMVMTMGVSASTLGESTAGTEETGSAGSTGTEETSGTEETGSTGGRYNMSSAIHLLNGEGDSSDYKVSIEAFSELHKMLSSTFFKNTSDYVWRDESSTFYNSDSLRDFSSVANSSDSDLITAKSYLIRNGMLHRQESYVWDGLHYVHSFVDEEGDDSTETMQKSDLAMSLYKAAYGTIESSPVVLRNDSVRNAVVANKASTDYWTEGTVVSEIDDYWDDGLLTSFSKGDYYVYVTPNEYELYFKELLDRGILLKSDFPADSSFIADYENFASKRPVWYTTDSYVTNKSDNNLGSSFTIAKNHIEQKEPAYFSSDDDPLGEDLTTLDALQMIERYLRLTEKDMTETEATIISYKYGASYLSSLDEDAYVTASFLIAKGVLNFEDSSQIINLYGTLSKADAYKLLYRVANPDARFDFSKVQLTDSDSYWQERGFSKGVFEYYSVNSQPIIIDAQEPTEYVEESSGVLGALMRFLPWVSSANAASTTYWNVYKQFDTVNEYLYNGKAISDLVSGAENDSEVTDAISRSISQSGGTVNVYSITFKVKAISAEAASAYVNANIRANIADNHLATLSGVTKMSATDGSSNVIILVSQTTLKQAFKNVSVLEDKVLQNDDTGALACILEDNNCCLIGNQIIMSADLMVTESSGEVYYNIDIIYSLLGNTFFENIGYGTGAVFTWTGMPEYEVDVTTSVSGSTVHSKAHYMRAIKKNDKYGAIVSEDSDYDGETTLVMYKVNSITNGLSTLTRKFMADEIATTVIVDWEYVVPSVEGFSEDADLDDAFSSQPTMQDALDYLSTRPEDGTVLQAWWDSNIGVSNALANFMYGTKGVEYVTCGYMVPSLTVLFDRSGMKDKDIKKTLNALFKNNGFAIASEYSRYVLSTTDWWEAYYEDYRGIGNETVLSLAKRYRKFSTHVRSSGTSAHQIADVDAYGVWYSTSYFISKSGVLYRNIKEDSTRLSYDLSSSSHRLNSITVKSRTSSLGQPAKQSIITYKDKEFVYLGVDSNGYIKLGLYEESFLDTLKAGGFSTLRITNLINQETAWGSNGSFDINKLYPHTVKESWASMCILYNRIFDYSNAARDSNLAHKRYSNFMGLYPTDFSVSGCYFDGSSYYNKTAVGAYERLTNEEVQGLASNKNLYVTALPVFRLPSGTYFFNKTSEGDYVLKKGFRAAALHYTSLYYSGLNDTVINSILAQSIHARKVGDLPTGTKLCIGDVIWTKKKDGYWKANPIQDSALVSACRNLTNNSRSLITAMTKFYGGLQISADGRFYDLTSYFSDYKLGTKTSISSTNASGIICRNSRNAISIWKNKQHNPVTASATYASVEMMISDNLLVRPLDSTGGTWTILYSATAGADRVFNCPFYSEDLSYGESTTAPVSVLNSGYEPSEIFLAQREEFKSLFAKAFAGDLWSLLKAIIVCAAAYLATMSWIAYAMLTLGYGRFLLEALAIQESSGKSNGIDVMKLATFNVYSLDNEPTLARAAVVMSVCMLVDLIILTYL